MSDDDHLTGKNIGAQIKSGSQSFSRRVPGEWTFSEDNLKHYNHGLGHRLPIIVILHHAAEPTATWVRRIGGSNDQNLWMVFGG